MKLTEIINNEFINRMYPDGDLGVTHLGQLFLDIDKITIGLHIQKEPKIKVKKWGAWGKDYNMIVIEVTCSLIQRLNIENWSSFDVCSVSCSYDENNMTYGLKLTSNDWNVSIRTKAISFQKCSVYIH